MRIRRYIISLLLITGFIALILQVNDSKGKTVKLRYSKYINNTLNNYILPKDTPNPDINLHYPIKQEDPLYNGPPSSHPIYLHNPSNFTDSVSYDSENNEFIFNNKIGGIDNGAPNTMTFKEYQDYDMDKSLKSYWHERTKAASIGNRGGGLIPQLKIGGEVFDKIFGSNVISIKPQGSAELIFGVIGNSRQDPSLNVKQRSTLNFDFQEKIQMSVDAKIGDKIEFKTNYNTESMFAFENKLKLKYEGKEDEILQLIEAGDVNLPLNSTLIQGSQSLFGIKTKLKFGRTTVTGVFSEQKSESKNITVQGGAETSNFKFKADQYEENKHFFIAQYFRENYNKALSTLPIISSNINITKIEVWRTNIGAPTTNNRNIVALTDLGEFKPSGIHVTATPYPGSPLPADSANSLSKYLVDTSSTNSVRDINTCNSVLQSAGFNSGSDYEKVESAKKLMPNEFTFNSRLGFISLNQALNPDQVLAVAFQFTVIGDPRVYQVGEFSDQGINDPKALVVKLLKSSTLNTYSTLWKLMMKNVYSLGAYQINKQDFRLNILYTGDQNGVPTGFFTDGSKKGIPLIRLLHLDTLDAQMNPNPDGVFDFIDNAATQGGTIQATNGRVYLPLVEPFGSDLAKILLQNAPGDTAFVKKYCFDSLYTLTRTLAQQYPDKDKFYFSGTYKASSGSEISLGGFNIPQGSVKVTSGGMPLTENVDYTVDYTLGRVKIINEGILNSGQPINISLESNSMFNIMTKRMMAAHVNYEVNKDFNIGGTIMNLHQSPLTQKVNYGDEPISNTIWGLDLSYQTESRLLTKMVDALPFIQTKAPSKVNFYGEFAQFIPGHSSAIGSSGTTYIDDFEGSLSAIDIKNVGSWFLASTPEGQTQFGMFPEARTDTTWLNYGFNRAKLAWYVIDPLMYDPANKPPNISTTDQSAPYAREVFETEVFPNKELPNGTPSNIAVLSLAYYPSERGPYNYDVEGVTGMSRGLKADGTLNNPDTRWGGIMRKLETTDFEATNVEYIQFWMMDPFITNPNHSGGQLYFNLGDVSEDILRDGRKSYENGLPTSAVVTNVDTTIWGRVPKLQALVNAFDNDPNARPFQDVGYDGLGDADERTFFNNTYLQRIATAFGAASQAYVSANADPSADDYHYFRGDDYDNDNNFHDITVRYKKFSNPEGNSPVGSGSYPTMATTMPNVEDINYDNTLSESENYYQYVIDLRPSKMVVGQNYITDMHEAQGVRYPDGTIHNTKWYQFKIPVRSPDKVIGSIQNFQSIRFLRMFLKGFSLPITCRFATFGLVRGDWFKYGNSLLANGDYTPTDQSGTSFNISAVNIEENGSRSPVPYVIPPGIARQINQATTNLAKLNEQSLSMKVINLADGDAKAIYKTTDFDLRQFKHLQMFTHAEKVSDPLKNGDMTVFVRLGSDFTENYYEYELPLAVTPWGVGTSDDNMIWPEVNNVDIDLLNIVSIKENRNVLIRQGNTTVGYSKPYSEHVGSAKITVLGSPNLGSVKTIMVGIRNPKKQSINDNDDMLPKSAEVWIDELRLTDFIDKTGWAATARVRANLADLGDVASSISHTSAGFGSIEQKITETKQDNVTSYDVATNLQLDKFFPKKLGLKIPMHYDYSKSISAPKYNPLDPDVQLADDLNTYPTTAQQDSIKSIVEDYTTRKNINFMNVRKEKVGSSLSKPKFYDVENLDFSYSYSEIYHRNIDIEYDLKQSYKGGIGYNFVNNPKNVRPFQRIGFISKYKLFSLLKEFNFYYAPKLMSFRTEMDREYEENKLRNKTGDLIVLEPTYFKTINWNRIYSLKFDFATSLTMDYTATTNAVIDEPQGRIDTKEKKDSIWTNVFDMGRMQHFGQNMNINYNIPINKIPIFSWISANARYGSDYKWDASPLSLKSFGNTIENANTKQLNGNINMTNLFEKIPYIKKLNQKNKPTKMPTTVPKGKGIKIENKTKSSDDENDTIKKPAESIFKKISDGLLRFVTGIKTASISYNENQGILLPGFMPTPTALGNDFGQNAPGFGFVFGSQQDIRPNAVKNHWLSTDTLMNNQYLTKYSNTLNARMDFEPFNEMKIEIIANRTYTENHSEFFKSDANGNFPINSPVTPVTTGSFSISFLSFATAFTSNNTDNSNKTFQTFLDDRRIIATRLANANPHWNHTYSLDTASGKLFPTGYGATSQDVLIPAFLAAYSGRNPSNVMLSPFPKIPLPNWTITYTGLSKLRALKKYVKLVTITNSYRSTYSVGAYTTNILYNSNDGYQQVINTLGNYISARQIDQVIINEQFAPLIKIDITWQNSLMTNIEIKKSRNLSLSFTNNQLTELTSNEYIVGLGYRIKDVQLNIIAQGGKTKKLKSDINLKCNLSLRSNETILRRIDENVNQISQGQQVISINTSADYMLSERFKIRVFFDKVINNPFISSSFPQSTTNAGLSLTFSLAQ